MSPRQTLSGPWVDSLVRDFVRNVAMQINCHDEPMPGAWLCGGCAYASVGSLCTKCGGPRYEGRSISMTVPQRLSMVPRQDDLERAQDEARAHAVDLVYRRLKSDWGETTKDQITAVLHAAEEEFDHVFGPDTVVCLDCRGKGVPRCDIEGHGLALLSDLMDNYA